MITEKQLEALKNLTNYVTTYCDENEISVFMTAAVSEEHSTGTEQICSGVVLGSGKHIIGSLTGTIRADRKVSKLLSAAISEAAQGEGKITTIPMGNINAN